MKNQQKYNNRGGIFLNQQTDNKWIGQRVGILSGMTGFEFKLCLANNHVLLTYILSLANPHAHQQDANQPTRHQFGKYWFHFVLLLAFWILQYDVAFSYDCGQDDWCVCE